MELLQLQCSGRPYRVCVHSFGGSQRVPSHRASSTSRIVTVAASSGSDAHFAISKANRVICSVAMTCILTTVCPATLSEPQSEAATTAVVPTSVQVPAGGVTPIFTDDSGPEELDSLLSDAMSFIKGATEALQSTNPSNVPPEPKTDKEDLLKKLRAERERMAKLRVEEEADRKQKAEQKAQAAEKAKQEAEAKAKAEAARKEQEAARKARDEEEKKAAEARIKEEREKRVRAEKERQEAEKQRELEAERRKIERLLAAAGGAGFGVSISLFSEVFRLVGGPTLVAAILRTPGYVVGKTFRLVEWDLSASPSEPNGALVSTQVRTAQLTRQGIREAIAKAYSLESSKSVKQFAHIFVNGTRVFYERLDTQQSVVTLDEGTVLVWTQTSPSKLIMPARNDQLPSKPRVGSPSASATKAIKEAATSASKERSMVEALCIVAALSRREAEPWRLALSVHNNPRKLHLDDSVTEGAAGTSASSRSTTFEQPASRSADDSSSAPPSAASAAASAMATIKSTNGASSHASDSDASSDDEGCAQKKQAALWEAHPLCWDRVRHLPAPLSDDSIVTALERLGSVLPRDEAAMVAAALNSDPAVVRLFHWYGEKDVFRFAAYVRAHVGRHL